MDVACKVNRKTMKVWLIDWNDAQTGKLRTLKTFGAKLEKWERQLFSVGQIDFGLLIMQQLEGWVTMMLRKVKD